MQPQNIKIDKEPDDGKFHPERVQLPGLLALMMDEGEVTDEVIEEALEDWREHHPQKAYREILDAGNE